MDFCRVWLRCLVHWALVLGHDDIASASSFIYPVHAHCFCSYVCKKGDCEDSNILGLNGDCRRRQNVDRQSALHPRSLQSFILGFLCSHCCLLLLSEFLGPQIPNLLRLSFTTHLHHVIPSPCFHDFSLLFPSSFRYSHFPSWHPCLRTPIAVTPSIM